MNRPTKVLLCSLLLLGMADLGCAADDAGTAAGAPGSDGGGVAPLDPGSPVFPGLSNVPELDNKCAGIRTDAPVNLGAVDVVWVIDNSASMVDELGRVQQNLASFIDTVSKAGADTRVAIVTALDPAAGTPLASDTSRYRYVGANVDSGALYTVMLSQVGALESFLRPNSPTHLIMVTDDNDLIPGPLFRQQMEGALGHPFILHAIASENINGRACANPICGGIPIPAICGAAAPGDAYYEAARSTGGETLSICSEDWNMVFGRLQNAVIASVPLPCDYTIPERSAPIDPDRVQVVYTDASNVDRQFPRAEGAAKCGASIAWYYDSPAQPSRVTLCPEACKAVQGGGSMDIAFGCAPILL